MLILACLTRVSGLVGLIYVSGVLQTKQLADMKVLLRDSAERERTLMQEKQELEEKVYFSYQLLLLEMCIVITVLLFIIVVAVISHIR